MLASIYERHAGNDSVLLPICYPRFTIHEQKISSGEPLRSDIGVVNKTQTSGYYYALKGSRLCQRHHDEYIAPKIKLLSFGLCWRRAGKYSITSDHMPATSSCCVSHALIAITTMQHIAGIGLLADFGVGITGPLDDVNGDPIAVQNRPARAPCLAGHLLAVYGMLLAIRHKPTPFEPDD